MYSKSRSLSRSPRVSKAYRHLGTHESDSLQFKVYARSLGNYLAERERGDASRKRRAKQLVSMIRANAKARSRA